MRNTITLCFSLITLMGISAQRETDLCELSEDWKQIILVDEPIHDTIPKIFVVTNRPFFKDDDEGVYFPNAIADFRKVTYIEVGCTNNKWLVRPVESFEKGMHTIDKGKDILVFIHGHGKSFPKTIFRAMQITKRYDVPLILFDWPAQHGNFNKSLARVRRCSDNFYNLLLNLKNYRNTQMEANQHLSILAHSLGNYYLTHFVVNGGWQYQQVPFIDNVIFSAPAIRSKEHGEALSLLNISNNKFVTSNKFDKVLRGAHLLTSGKMLGNEVIKPLATNTLYFDFTKIAGHEHTYYAGYHSFEYENKTVYEFYYSLFHGDQPGLEASKYNMIEENIYEIK